MQPNAGCLVTIPDAQAELRAAVKDMQITRALGPWWAINVTSFGLGEVRAIIEGAMFLYGVRADAVHGNNFAEKANTIAQSSGQAFKSMVAASGFSVTANAGAVVAIPPGYILVQFQPRTSDSPLFVRWSVLREDEKPTAKSTITDFMQGFPWLKGTEYQSVFDLL